MSSIDRPGGGFLVLLLVLAGAGSFVAWGLVTPDLDRFWRIQLELRLGKRGPLDHRELALVEKTLCKHPDLVDEGLISANRDGLVDTGWAYFVGPSLTVSVPSGEKKKKIEILARTRSEKITGEASVDKPFHWTPKPEGKCGTLIEVLTSKNRAVRISGGAEQ